MIEKISAIGSRAKTHLTSITGRISGAVRSRSESSAGTATLDKVNIHRNEKPEIDPKHIKTSGLLGAVAGVMAEAPLGVGLVLAQASGVAIPAAVALGAIAALPIAGAAVAVGAALYLRHKHNQSNN